MSTIVCLFVEVDKEDSIDKLLFHLNGMHFVNGVYDATDSTGNVGMPPTLEDIEIFMENK